MALGMSAADDPAFWSPAVDIDLDALCGNFRLLADAAPSAEPSAVVKCDGYGLGAVPVARALALRENCRTFFVAYPEEGARLRAGLADIAPQSVIYVFNGPRAETLQLFMQHRLTPALNSLEQAALWADAFPGAGACLHIDTGMHRLGAPYTELQAVAALKGLALDLVMSHLACSSDPDHAKNPQQLEAFEKACAQFPGVRRSLAASSGALLPAAYHYDVTRLGVGLYGGNPLDAPPSRVGPVATLTAPVVQLRDAAAGETVGYAATHAIDSPRRLAVVQLGYGDGFPRIGGGRAAAWLGGALCPVVGRISMDYMVLDVTDAPQPPVVGARAEFFGRNRLIDDAAAACLTLPYELLTGLGARVHRRYLWKNEPAQWPVRDSPGGG